jgi:hypothetical protein
MKKLSLDEFLLKLKQYYPNLSIDFDKNTYLNSKNIITFHIKGKVFNLYPHQLSTGDYKFRELGLCRNHQTKSPKEILDIIVKRTKEKHPNLFFDLKMDEKNYTTSRNKCDFILNNVKIIKSTPHNLMNHGLSLKDLGMKKQGLIKLSAEQVLKYIQEGWTTENGKIIPPRPFLSFNLSEYKGVSKKVTFHDEKYGSWHTEIWSILYGGNHMMRSKAKTAIEMKLSIEEAQSRITNGFMGRDKRIIPPRDYLIIDEKTYQSATSPCKIIDREHGEFWAKPQNIMVGQDHPKRTHAKSQYEREIEIWLETLGIPCVRNQKFKIDKAFKEVDVLIPHKNVGIDYHGLYWHSEEMRDKQNHLKRRLFFEKSGIFLFQIFADECRDKTDIVKGKILERLNFKQKKIDSEQCHVKTISKKEANEFLSKNHIEGPCLNKSQYYVGLYYKSDLKAVMTYRIKSKTLEVIRFSNKLNHLIKNSYAALTKQLISSHNSIQEIQINLDLRLEDKSSLITQGYEHQKTKLNYQWTDFMNRFHQIPEKDHQEDFSKIYGAGIATFKKIIK